MSKLSVFSAAVFSVLYSSLSVTFATELTTDKATCTTLNCAASTIQGRFGKSERCCGFANYSLPWVANVFAGANECLRLHVTSQSTDSEMVVLSPAGTDVWRSNNGGGTCPTCPQLRIFTGVAQAGWYTVQIGQPDGVGLEGTFVLRYGRYPSTNPNCGRFSAPLPPAG